MGRASSPTVGAVRAYRGAVAENCEGLSWTLDRAQAEYFARSRQGPWERGGRVWVTNIPVGRVFALYPEGPEKEVVADVRGLEIRPIEDEEQLPRIPWWRRRHWL